MGCEKRTFTTKTSTTKTTGVRTSPGLEFGAAELMISYFNMSQNTIGGYLWCRRFSNSMMRELSSGVLRKEGKGEGNDPPPFSTKIIHWSFPPPLRWLCSKP